jgi:hypothetical protein
LHPWHPDVQALTEHQLLWAMIQGREERGMSPRTKRSEAKAEERSKLMGDILAWADAHITGN